MYAIPKGMLNGDAIDHYRRACNNLEMARWRESHRQGGKRKSARNNSMRLPYPNIQTSQQQTRQERDDRRTADTLEEVVKNFKDMHLLLSRDIDKNATVHRSMVTDHF